VWILGSTIWANAAGWPGPDGAGYSGEVASYDLVDAFGIAFGVPDGSVIGPLNIGFDFPFYGSTHNQIYLSDDGFLTFAPFTPTPLNQCPLPDSVLPNGVIAAMWDDLEGYLIHVVTFSPGFCPFAGYQRACLVVRWDNFYHVPVTSGVSAGTFEMILQENGDIVIQFEDAGDELGSGSTTGIEGDDVGSDHGLVFACDTASSLADGDAIRFRADTGLTLAPDDLELTLCDGRPHPVTLTLVNRTGSAGTFGLSYDVPSGNASLTGPPSLTVPDGAVSRFTVELTTEPCAASGQITATITATGNGRSDVMTMTTGTGDTRFYTVPGSTPPWRGLANFGDGCTALNDQGHWVTWILHDGFTPGFSGLWGYDHTAVLWTNPSVSRPTDRFGPDWAYDPDSNLCYLTGGRDPQTTFAETWVLDPVAVSFSQLADMTTGRSSHASWVTTIASTRVLCVGGGQDMSNLDSTQCFDIGAGSWLAEDVTLGPLPQEMSYAADGVNRLPTGDQLWFAGGQQGANSYTDDAHYFDVATGSWENGGASGVDLSDAGGGFLDGVFYQFGGTLGGSLAEPPVLRAVFDGSVWQWEEVTDRVPARLAPVVAELPGAIAVVDGYRTGSNTDVEVFEPCPSCLRGTVSDFELPATSPPCTTAEVLIEPVSIVAPVDPITGAWGPVELGSGEFEIIGTAPGYQPTGPIPITLLAGVTTVQDLSLQRPVVDFDPQNFEVWWPNGFPTARSLTLADAGHVDLIFDILEVPPEDWLTVSPTTGVIPALNQTPIRLDLACTGEGDFGTDLVVNSNDPCNPGAVVSVVMHCLPDGLFADGFETGDTSAWASVAP